MPEIFAQALQAQARNHTGGRSAVADIRLQRTKRTLPETAAAEKLFQRPGFRPIFMRVSAAVSLK